MNTTTNTRPLVERITQGPMHAFRLSDYLIIGEAPPAAGAHIARMTTRPDMEANAELIADAFNTAHRTRRTPSELASERQELLDMLTTLLDRAETVAEGIPVDKRHAGVSPATHVAHMASHLAQHCKPARELINRLTKTTNPTEQ